MNGSWLRQEQAHSKRHQTIHISKTTIFKAKLAKKYIEKNIPIAPP
jgi:hypothetical protein